MSVSVGEFPPSRSFRANAFASSTIATTDFFCGVKSATLRSSVSLTLNSAVGDDVMGVRVGVRVLHGCCTYAYRGRR